MVSSSVEAVPSEDDDDLSVAVLFSWDEVEGIVDAVVLGLGLGLRGGLRVRDAMNWAAKASVTLKPRDWRRQTSCMEGSMVGKNEGRVCEL